MLSANTLILSWMLLKADLTAANAREIFSVISNTHSIFYRRPIFIKPIAITARATTILLIRKAQEVAQPFKRNSLL